MTWSNVRSLRGDTREQRVTRHLERRLANDWPPELEAQYQALKQHLGPEYETESHQALTDHYAARDTARNRAQRAA